MSGELGARSWERGASHPSPRGRGWREAPGEGRGTRDEHGKSHAPHPAFGHLLPPGEGPETLPAPSSQFRAPGAAQ
jgi:hypothetical protein